MDPGEQFRGELGFFGRARVLATPPGGLFSGQADFSGRVEGLSELHGQFGFSGQYLLEPTYRGQGNFGGQCGVEIIASGVFCQGQVDFQGLALLDRSAQGEVDFIGRATPDFLFRGQVGFGGGVTMVPLYRGQFGFAGIAILDRVYRGQIDMQGIINGVEVKAVSTDYVNDHNPGFKRRGWLEVPASSVKVSAVGVLYVIETAPELRSKDNGGFFEKSLSSDGYLDVQVEAGGAVDGSGGGTPLPSQAIYHDPASGALCLAVRLTYATAGNDIFIYIGNATMPAPTALPFQDFAQVIDPRTGKDLSGNGRHLTAVGGTFPPATTLLGMPAAQFDGVNNILSAPPWSSWGGWSAATADLWAQADDDVMAAGGDRNRGLFVEAVKDAEGSDSAISLYWRSGNAAQTKTNLIFGGYLTTGTPSLAWTGTPDDSQPTGAALMAIRWQNASPAEQPQIWASGAQMTQDSGAAAAGTIIKAPGTGAVEMLGYGPSHLTGSPQFQEKPWKGKLSLFRFRTVRASDGLLQMEYANQSDPRMFYGLSAWDARGDANRSPIAIPDRPADVPYSASGTLLDVMANDLDPNGDALLLTSGGFGNFVNCSVTKDTATGKALFVGTASKTPPYQASFTYTVRDNVTPTKSSIGKVVVNVVAGGIVAVEMPTPLRRIWGNSGFSVGLTEAKLDLVLAATGNPGAWPTGVFVDVQPGGAATPRTLQPGDHVMLAGGTANTFTDARTITQSGTAANPIVFRALGAIGSFPTAPVIAQKTWRLDGSHKRLWGFRFNRSTTLKEGNRWACGRLQFGLYQAADASKSLPQVIAPSAGNGAVRCEFTDWTKGYAAPVYGNGGPDQPGSYLWYCTFHHPYPWGDPFSGDPDPIVSNSNTIRMAVRSFEQDDVGGGIVGTFPYNFHVKRCYWHDFSDKPLLGSNNYNSGQNDALEWAQTGPAVGLAKFTATRSGGIVTAVTDYLKSNLLIEYCVVQNHLESGGACIDLKCGGNFVKHVALRNCNGRLDSRWGPFNTFEDISFESGSPGSWCMGWGHQITRTSGGGITMVSGKYVDAGMFDSGVPSNSGQQSCESCTVTDRTGTLTIGYDAYDTYKARNVQVVHASPVPGTGETNRRTGCGYTAGTVIAPQDIPDNTEVGHTAAWAG